MNNAFPACSHFQWQPQCLLRKCNLWQITVCVNDFFPSSTEQMLQALASNRGIPCKSGEVSRKDAGCRTLAVASVLSNSFGQFKTTSPTSPRNNDLASEISSSPYKNIYICTHHRPSAQRGCAHQRTVHFYGQLRLQPKKLLVFQTRTATKRGVYFTEHTQDATNQEIKAGPVAVLGRRKIIY